MVGLSVGEKHFLQGGINQNLCSDGRKRDAYRPIFVETGVIPQANGSARVRMGATEVIASVKAELGKPSALQPDKGKVAIFVDCSPVADPTFENLPPTEPTEKIEIEEVEIPNKDVDELNATHSLEQGTVLVKGAELQEVSGFEPQDQVAEKEKSADIAAIKDDGYAIEENLPSTELNEKIQIDKIVTQNKNGDELNVTHSLKPEITLLQPEELPEVSFFEPKNQVNEAEKLAGINAVEDDGISKIENLQPTESTEKIEIPEVKIPNKIVDELNAIDSLEQEAVLAQGEVSREVSNFEPQNEVNGKKSIDVDAIKDDGISKEKNLPPMEQYEKIETVEIEQNKKVDNLNAIHSFEREAEIVQHEELREISNLEPQSQIKEEEKLIDIDATKDNGIQKVNNGDASHDSVENDN